MTSDDLTRDLVLAAEFKPATYDDWRKLAEGVLKGAAFEKLTSRSEDGLAIDPIYPRAQGASPVAGRAPAAMWQIMQRIDHPDAKAANAQALHDLENGADGLSLVFEGSSAARGFGLPPTPEAIATALDGVYLDAGIAIELELGPQSRNASAHVAEVVLKRGLDPAACNIRFGQDPIGGSAVFGGGPPWQDIAPVFAKTIAERAAKGFAGPFAVADGRVIHDAGGSEAQELAFVLACGVAYLRALEAGSIALDDARSMIAARLSADADQFLTMAKFRALRKLWARVEESCGLTPKPLVVSADTAWRMLTQRDPFVNMLRATMATFAAGLGGANAITVLPHTLALGLPDAFARRAARNTQLVLLHESNLAKVTDPAAGAGGIEALTAQLCEAAWAQFQAVEKSGGIAAALANGAIQSEVAKVRAARATSIARRKAVLTGASEFPNLNEARAKVLQDAAMPQGATTGTLTPIRLAAPFEALRDRSDAMLAKTGARPKVLLATLGTPADFTARTTFAKSFFETGGIEAVEINLPSPLRGAVGSGGPVPALACLCSSDKLYAAQAVDAAKALHAAGCKHIYLAGRPGDLEASLREAGVSDFIFAGGDAVTTLEGAYKAVAA